MNRWLLVAIAVILCLHPCSAFAQEQVLYYHTDAIGSVRMITDANGQVVERHDYLPFGEEYPLTQQQPSVEKRLFGGTEHDQETGFEYFGARYFGSGSGRFITADSFFNIEAAQLDPQRWNRYAYVGNNPLRYVDPTGLYQFEVQCVDADSDCLNNQQRFRDSLAAIRRAADNLETGSKERNRLERVLRSIGEKEGSGATIAFGSAGETARGPAMGSTSGLSGKITLNVAAIDGAQSIFNVEGDLFLQATIAHEGDHRSTRLNPFPWMFFLNKEIGPYTAESYFYQGLRIDDPQGYLWKNEWLRASPAERERLRNANIRLYDRLTK